MIFKIQQKIAPILLLAFVAGCAADPLEIKRIESVIQPWLNINPTVSNQYTGELIHGPSVDANKIISFAQDKCASFGGLNQQSFVNKGGSLLGPVSGVNTQGYLKSYKCNTGISVEVIKIPSTTIIFDVAKSKCEELGFKPETEGFGKCVLQLSK